MAEKIVSPGVFTRENDLSFLPAGVGAIGAAIVGPTVKGPAGIPTMVTSYAEYVEKFGDTFQSGSDYYQYLTSHTAERYLQFGGALTVVRVTGQNAAVMQDQRLGKINNYPMVLKIILDGKLLVRILSQVHLTCY